MTSPTPGCVTEPTCLTCGDVAVVLTVVELLGADARCEDAVGRGELVALELVADVGPGARVLVHAGVALRVVPEVEEEADALRR